MRTASFNVYADGRAPDGHPMMRQSYHSKCKKTGVITIHKYSCSYFQWHRLILHEYRPNPDESIFTDCDHIDGNPENDKLENLRWATKQMNMLNRKHTKGFTRVVRRDGLPQFRTNIRVGNRNWLIGYYHTEEEAHAQYVRVRDTVIDYLGKYWRHYIVNRKPGEAPQTTTLHLNPLQIDPDSLTYTGRKLYPYMP